MLYIPNKTEDEIEEINYDFVALQPTKEYFHIGQLYDKNKAEKQCCNICKSDKFEIALGNHFTAIRCPNCNWEKCIHEG